MKVSELISKLQAMPPNLDVIVNNSREELVIVTNVSKESLWFGNGDLNGCINQYHHPKLDETERNAIVIE